MLIFLHLLDPVINCDEYSRSELKRLLRIGAKNPLGPPPTMAVVSDDDEGFSTGSGSIKDDLTTEYETDYPDNIEEDSDSECEVKQKKETQEKFNGDDGDQGYSVKKTSTSSMYNNLRESDKQRKVSSLSAVESYPSSQNSATPKRKISFYLDFDPSATPPPSPRTPKQSETDKPNLF